MLLIRCFARSPLPLGILLILLLAFAPVRAGVAAEAMLNGQGILWEIAQESQTPNYLLGTIHIADERVLTLPPPVGAAFAASQRAIFEIIFDPSVRTTMARTMVLADGRNLEGIVGSELFAQAVEVAGDYGLPAQVLQVMKPWALVPIFSFPPEQFARVASGKAPLDEWLQQEAARRGKRLVGLETVEEQLSLFDGASEADQVALLRSVVVDRAAIALQFESLLAGYLARDTGSIYQEMLREAAESDGGIPASFEEDFVIARNRRMVDRLLPYLAEGGNFVAIGALHLPGEAGMVNLLAKAGYQVRPLY